MIQLRFMSLVKRKSISMKNFFYNFYKLSINTRLRPKIWLSFAIIYILFFLILHFFNVPLKSKSTGAHINILRETKFLHNEVPAYMKKQMDKFAKLSIEREFANEDSGLILTKTFKKADVNEDSILDTVELIAFIGDRIKEHLTLALKENIFIFTAIDINPRNGLVSWEEYLQYFLKKRGYDKKFILEHMTTLKGMPRETKEAVMREKAAWSQAVRDDPARLTLDEFLAFRHPESSHATIISLVEETLARLDVDEDGKLSQTEFSDPEFNEIPDHLNNNQFIDERIKEFREAVDGDGNGIADRKELIAYFNPHNIRHAEREALDLIALADVNDDGKLSLPEVLMHKEEFMRSKMIDVSISFHDEF